jgi:hypothetical protein
MFSGVPSGAPLFLFYNLIFITGEVMKRKCGTCDVCCITPSMEENGFEKSVGVACKYLDESKKYNKCKIYKDRPTCCSEFFCSWITGVGRYKDRPDRNNILTFVSQFNNGIWCVVVETKKDALLTTGRDMVINLSKMYAMPIIVELFDNKNKTGDWTIIKQSLFDRTSKMRGKFVEWLDKENTIGIYELVNSHEEK